jgi:hypothetical protein
MTRLRSMTSSSNALLDRVRDFVAVCGEADERVDTLLLRGTFTDAATQMAWLALASGLGTDLAIQIYNPAVGGDLTTADPFDPTRPSASRSTSQAWKDWGASFCRTSSGATCKR